MKLPIDFTGRGSMKTIAILAAVTGSTLFYTQRVSAASPPTATGTIAQTGTGALNTYSLTLNDAAASPSAIGSIWAAWIPGQFYLTSAPSLVTSPTGWTSNITPGGGGYGIQWIASSAAFDVPAGGSLSGFSFESPDLPASVFGTSSVVAGIPTMTTIAYDAGLFSDPGTKFVFTSTAVPEPATLALIAPVALLMRRRHRAQ